MAWLIAEGETPRRFAALVKLRSSATARKVARYNLQHLPGVAFRNCPILEIFHEVNSLLSNRSLMNAECGFCESS